MVDYEIAYLRDGKVTKTIGARTLVQAMRWAKAATDILKVPIVVIRYRTNVLCYVIDGKVA